MLRRYRIIGMLVILLLLMCSCTVAVNDTKAGEPNENKEGFDISSFSDIRNSAVKSDFISDAKEGDYESPIHYNGHYDMDCDSNPDTIAVTFTRPTDDVKSSVVVNDKTLDIYLDDPLGVYMIDLDKNDAFVELAIYDGGPSGDPNMKFYRYIGSEIIELGAIHDTILINGNGEAITTYQMVNFKPAVPLGYYEIKDNNLVFHRVPISDALNKEYEVPEDMEGFFKEMAEIPQDFIPTFTGEEKTILLKKGDEITLENIHVTEDVPYWYEVKLSDGKRGALYFWMGD
ncbi:MAG TPA: hypothetical protein VHT96_06815 [Clostridia bacterium]|nr:hypothetical protein [Clostridia bacterium]